jgi:hypothetical protein
MDTRRGIQPGDGTGGPAAFAIRSSDLFGRCCRQSSIVELRDDAPSAAIGVDRSRVDRAIRCRAERQIDDVRPITCLLALASFASTVARDRERRPGRARTRWRSAARAATRS